MHPVCSRKCDVEVKVRSQREVRVLVSDWLLTELTNAALKAPKVSIPKMQASAFHLQLASTSTLTSNTNIAKHIVVIRQSLAT